MSVRKRNLNTCKYVCQYGNKHREAPWFSSPASGDPRPFSGDCWRIRELSPAALIPFFLILFVACDAFPGGGAERYTVLSMPASSSFSCTRTQRRTFLFKCVCVCVCMCVCMYVCTYVHTYICTYHVLINPPTHPIHKFLPCDHMPYMRTAM